MYSHLVDEMKDSGVDARDPRFGQLKGGWFGRDQPRALPEHSRKYFERIKPEISLGADSVRTDRKKGDIGSYMLPESKWEKMAQYHQLHGALVGLVDRHRDDARSAVAELMDHKRRGKLWAVCASARSATVAPTQARTKARTCRVWRRRPRGTCMG
jgi:hypothetical protein